MFGFKNNQTGDVIQLPPPDEIGASVVIFNGRVVERILYSDSNGATITTEDGRVFTCDDWTAYLMEQLRTGAYAKEVL